MPKIIPMTELREWLNYYESGKSVASIAKQASRNTRTVKKGIEDARRERDGHGVRAQLIKEALVRHQGQLLGLLDDVLLALVLPAPDLRLDIPVPLSKAQVTYDPQRGLIAVLDIENTPQWPLLVEHLRRDPVSGKLILWRKALTEHIQARRALRDKVESLLREETGLPLIKDASTPPKVGYITPVAVELVYRTALDRGLGNQSAGKTELEGRLMVTADGRVKDRQTDSTLVDTPKKAKERRLGMLKAFAGLEESDQIKEVTKTHETLKEYTIKARRAVEQISMLGLVAGQCAICARLGI
jgi:hypothetical protein